MSAALRWPPLRRFEVAGGSMTPGLLPGDRLLLVSLPLREGRIVVARDPRRPERLILKRILHITGDGLVELRGDNPDASTDSRAFGPVPTSAVLGTAVYRYHPAERAGRLRNT